MSRFVGKLAIMGTFCALALCSANTAAFAQQEKIVNETIRPKEMALKLDAALGVPAARIGQDKLRQVDVTVIEIPPGGKLAPHRHLAEEMIYFVSGKGFTEIWNGKSGKKQKYAWAEGDMLSPALNAWHQHFNASNSSPARYVSITTTPLMKNVFNNSAFLNANDFSFDDRWELSSREPQHYGNAKTGPDTVRYVAGQLFPNLIKRDLGDRGSKLLGITIDPEGDMAGNQLFEVEVRQFTNPDSTTPEHRHFWEVVYYILSGNGYVTMQKKGEAERRMNWKEGDLFIVEANEYHNHRPISIGARFLQFKASGYFRRVGLDDYMMEDKPGTAVKLN
jgi:quercetin dioxygenase-like cupin family protein